MLLIKLSYFNLQFLNSLFEYANLWQNIACAHLLNSASVDKDLLQYYTYKPFSFYRETHETLYMYQMMDTAE